MFHLRIDPAFDPIVQRDLADPRRREDLLRIARALESEPSIQVMSAHLLSGARRDAEPFRLTAWYILLY
jgi:hypothetical protein